MPRLQYLARAAFVPLVAAASADAAPAVQGGAPPGSLRTLQYQAVTGPVFVPSAGETVTLDKWVSQPPGRPALAWRPTGGTVAPLYVPDVTQPVTDRAWAPTYPDHIFGQRPADVPQTVAPLYVPDVTAPVVGLGWAPVYPDRVPGRLRAADFPQAVAPVETPAPAEVVTSDKWTPRYADRAPAHPRTTEGGTVAPLYVPDVTAPVAGIGWAPAYPDLAPGRQRPADFPRSVAPVETPAPTEVVTSDKWAPSYPARVPARPRTAEGAAVAPLYLADVTVTAPESSWAPTYPDRVPAARRSVLPDGVVAPVAPVADAPATNEAPAVQGGPAPGALRTLQYQALTGPVAVPAAAPAVALDWLTPPTLGRLDRGDGPAIQYAPFSGPVPRVLDLDWLPNLPDVRRRVTRPMGGMVAPVEPIAAPPETVTLDKWHAPYVTVARRGWRPDGAAVAPPYVPDVTVAAPARSWAPVYPDRVPARLRRPETGVTEALRDVLAVTLDWQTPPATVWRRVLRPHGGTVAPLYVPDVTAVPPLLSWSPVAPAYIIRLRTLRPLGWTAANIDPIGPPSHIAQSCLVVSGDRTSALLVSGDRVTPVTISALRQGFVYIVADRASAVSVSGDRASDVSIWIGECE